MDQFVSKKTQKVVLKIDDEGNEEIDEKYFKDIKKDLETEEDEEEESP